MPNNLCRGMIVTIFTAVLISPGLIYSDMRTLDAVMNNGKVKLPAFSTVGPRARPYTLTPIEQKKLLLPVTYVPLPCDIDEPAPPDAIPTECREYTGMTTAELEKLARMREATSKISTRSLTQNRDPLSTIEILPRGSGIEGMTPRERAKLEVYLERHK
ncbi:MAG: hypothetical protein JSW58_16595 [Candidatus Latescibacterota bacterium]|nr:MAG: hypothetical protein JSW58_16595 [Candidatus Latescibacterota bacterium]